MIGEGCVNNKQKSSHLSKATHVYIHVQTLQMQSNHVMTRLYTNREAQNSIPVLKGGVIICMCKASM